jgi:hypothetical protein
VKTGWVTSSRCESSHCLAVNWQRSTRCESAQCVETRWRRPARCESTACVEVTTLGAVLVRDSKDPDGGTLQFAPAAWLQFVSALKHGQLV